MKSTVMFLVLSICCIAQDAPTAKSRVYVTDSNSWQVSGEFGASNGSGAGYFSGGARPQTVEIIKTFGERCPGVTVSMDESEADYIVLFDRDGGKGYARKRDKIAVFEKGGDVLYSGSTRTVGSAVQDSCRAIEKQASLSSRYSQTVPLRAATISGNSDSKLVTAQTEADRRNVSRPRCLHNTDILSLRQAGFSDEVIIARIKSSLGLYEMGTDDLLNLKEAGLSQAIIAAMLAAPDHN